MDPVTIGTLLIGLNAVFRSVVSGLTAEAMIWGQSIQSRGLPEGFDETSRSFLSERGAYVSQILLGVILITGRQKIASLLWKARYAGTDADSRN